MNMPAEILANLELSPEGRQIAEVLVKLAPAFVPMVTIARRTGLDVDTIRRVIRGLEASGLVETKPSLHRDHTGARVVTTGRA